MPSSWATCAAHRAYYEPAPVSFPSFHIFRGTRDRMIGKTPFAFA